MTIQELNKLNRVEATMAFGKCCGAQGWIQSMLNKSPFSSKQDLMKKAHDVWYDCSQKDWLSAFKHHPKIGDVDSLREKFQSTKEWAGDEQSGVNSATEKTIKKLAEGNALYEEKFGYIFIVCATGKTAEQMLALLEDRLPNNAEEELKIAMEEQNKITKIRLEKLLV